MFWDRILNIILLKVITEYSLTFFLKTDSNKIEGNPVSSSPSGPINEGCNFPWWNYVPNASSYVGSHFHIDVEAGRETIRFILTFEAGLRKAKILGECVVRKIEFLESLLFASTTQIIHRIIL